MSTPKWYWPAVGICSLIVLIAATIVGYMINKGLGITGLNRPVMWGFFITNFVFWIGMHSLTSKEIGMGCYLVADEMNQGTLYTHWSKTTVDGALAPAPVLGVAGRARAKSLQTNRHAQAPSSAFVLAHCGS